MQPLSLPPLLVWPACVPLPAPMWHVPRGSLIVRRGYPLRDLRVLALPSRPIVIKRLPGGEIPRWTPRPKRPLPRTRRLWGRGWTWRPLPRRLGRPLRNALGTATAILERIPRLSAKIRGPWAGLWPAQPRRRRRFWARRHVGGARLAPRATFTSVRSEELQAIMPGLAPLPVPEALLGGWPRWRRPALWSRLAAATARQAGALRARAPRPQGHLGAPRPHTGPGLGRGLTPPSSVPSLLPQDMTPPLRGLLTPLRALEVWQRAWIVGLLLRPRGWAAYLRF